VDDTNTGHDPGRGGLIFVHVVRSERAQFQEGGIAVEQKLQSLSDGELSTGLVFLKSFWWTTRANLGQPIPIFLDEVEHLLPVLFVLLARGMYPALYAIHRCPLILIRRLVIPPSLKGKSYFPPFLKGGIGGIMIVKKKVFSSLKIPLLPPFPKGEGGLTP
jgi:hypothetical protein